MFKKTDKSEVNLLELIPHRICEYEVDSEDRVTVSMPRFKSPWMTTFFVPRRKSPYIHTKLDEFGSFVWQQCDGSRNVHEITQNLREKFGEELEPMNERLKLFFQQLALRSFMELRFTDGKPLHK